MDGIRIKDIMNDLEALAPKDLAESYDNVGLLVGDPEAKAETVLVGLELTDDLLEMGIREKVSLIVVHHPLIFRPLKAIVAGDPVSNRVMSLIKHDIGLYAAHTNLDATTGGLNDYVASLLGIELDLAESDEPRIVRTGSIDATDLLSFAKRVKEILNLETIRYVGDEKQSINRVGLCTGSGMSFYNEAVSGKVDAYITGDLKYHEAMMALDFGVPVIDASHFGSEIIVKDLLHQRLSESFKGQLKVIKGNVEVQPIKTL